MAVQRNAGRRVITRDKAQARATRDGSAESRAGLNRREFLAYALAASGALLATGAVVTLTMPDPSEDPLLGRLIPYTVNSKTGEKIYPIAGGYAYPRIKAGAVGGRFALDQRASAFSVNDPPMLKVALPAFDSQGGREPGRPAASPPWTHAAWRGKEER